MNASTENYKVLEKVGLSKSLFDNGQLAIQTIRIDQGAQVFGPSDICGAFIILISGQLRIEMTSRSGRELLLYQMQHQGETCVLTTSALLNNEAYYARAIAETDIEAFALPAQKFFQALAMSSSFTNYVLRDYATRISFLVQLIDRFASKDVEYDICEYLLRKRQPDNSIHITQKEIARDIGSAREVVSRKLSILEREGALSCERSKIKLIDLERIKKKLKYE